MAGRIFHADDASAVVPAALPALARLRAQGLTHRFVLHVRSSQAFALNLFAPLDEAGRRQVLADLGLQVDSVEPVVFEFIDPVDRLQEASRPRGHQTQVDVLLGGTTSDGHRVCALIEVKLGETGFGGCSAFDSPHNTDVDTCRRRGLFGGQPEACFQLRNHGHGHRRYADYLAGVTITPPTGPADDGGCWVRADRSQPMRNLALAHALVATGEYTRAVFATCSPAQHLTLWRRWAEFRSMFADTTTVTTATLHAERVAARHPDQGAEVRRRYTSVLTPTPPDDGMDAPIERSATHGQECDKRAGRAVDQR